MVSLRWLGLAIVGLVGAIAMLLSPMMSVTTFGSQPSTSAIIADAPAVAWQARSVPGTVRDPARYGAGLKRTLYLLASSTPTQRHTVRILFYGQSITKQEWWIQVVDKLRERFPNANLMVENRAIGGFASPLLVRAAEHDLYSFYPDLMIFQNYGDEQNYEAMIANTRRRTTAEIALMSDHIDWLPGEPNENFKEATRVYEWHNQHVNWLGAIAQKYGCELIDIRTPWEHYLKDNHLRSTMMQIENDGHLNRQGNRLLAKLVGDHLLQSPIPATNTDKTTIVDYPQAGLQWKNGRLRQEFFGNRIDLITRQKLGQSLLSATVLIDGKLPSQLPELYHLTRSSDSFGVDMPALLRVESKAPLQLESWSLIIREATPQMDRFEFDLYGSKTGFDGKGVSTQPFVSQSGRIAIAPNDWWLDDAYQFTKKPVPEGFQIRWRVEPMFADVYTPPSIVETSREVTTTLAQNLSNSRHVLELISHQDQPVPFDAIRVYRPPVR